MGKRVFAISRIFALTVYISTILVETVRKTKKKIPRIER